MLTNIYIHNDNNIEVYEATINIELLKKLQKIEYRYYEYEQQFLSKICDFFY